VWEAAEVNSSRDPIANLGGGVGDVTALRNLQRFSESRKLGPFSRQLQLRYIDR